MIEKKEEYRKKNIKLVYWFIIAVVILIGDYFAGPYIQFPVTYIIPIAFVSWHNGRFWGLVFAFTMSLFRLYFNMVPWTTPWTYTEAALNFSVSFTVFSLFALLYAKTAENNRKLAKQVDDLSGLLPICSNCKKIKDDTDDWENMEEYIEKKSKASFTHGLCPECKNKLYGSEIEKLRREKKNK